jgi:hypothetical protein
MAMDVRPFTATRRRVSANAVALFVVAFISVGCQTNALAQSGRPANPRPAQGPGTANSFNAYGMPRIGGRYWPYPVKDTTADERAVVAGSVYRALLGEWAQRAVSTLRPGSPEPDVDARSIVELAERLGVWSLRWQAAQDNAARTRAARYQALSDHLGRMSALGDGQFSHATGPAAGGLVAMKPPRAAAEVARFFRPIDEWDIDRIIPTLLVSERPINPVGVAVAPAELFEIAARVYHEILDEAVDRFLASPRGGQTRADEVPIFDSPLAERLGFWSDLWSQSQELAAKDPSWRPSAVGDGSARIPSAGVRTAGPSARMPTIRSHIERTRELENGRFVDEALKRTGRTAAKPVDWSRYNEFASVVRFLRIEAESWMSGAPRPKGMESTDSAQAATASRIYRAILDEAAHRYVLAPRAGQAVADVRLIFDSRLAERLAAWSIRWARAQIRTDLSRVSQFNAVRSHAERMASLEDGRSFHDALERAGHRVVGVAASAPPREFVDVARFFRLEALWELAQVKSR